MNDQQVYVKRFFAASNRHENQLCLPSSIMTCIRHLVRLHCYYTGEAASPAAISSPSAAASRLGRQRRDHKSQSLRSAAVSLLSQDASSDGRSASPAGSWDGKDTAQQPSKALFKALSPGNRRSDASAPASPMRNHGGGSDSMQHPHIGNAAGSPGGVRSSAGTASSLRQHPSVPQRSRLQHGSADSNRFQPVQAAENGHGLAKDAGIASGKPQGHPSRAAPVRPSARSRELNPALFPLEVQTARMRDLTVSATDSPKSLSPHSVQLSSPAFSDRSQPHFSYLGRQRTVSSSTQASDEDAVQRAAPSPFLVCADSDGLPVLLKDGKIQGRAAPASASQEARPSRPPQSMLPSHAAHQLAGAVPGQQGQRLPAAAVPLQYDSQPSQQLQPAPAALRDAASSRAAANGTNAGHAMGGSSSQAGGPLSRSAQLASQQPQWETGTLPSSSMGRLLGQPLAGTRSIGAPDAVGDWLRQRQHLTEENFWRTSLAQDANGNSHAQHAAAQQDGRPSPSG